VNFPTSVVLPGLLALLAFSLQGCGGGMFVNCPEGASKIDTSDGGFSCQRPDGASHGPFRTLHPNGKVSELGNYVDGLEDGVFEGWFDDGKQFSLAEYRMGQPWGTFTVWHDNGVKALVRGYDEGVPVGVHRWRDDEGNPAQELEYKDGKKARSSRWGRRGQKVHEALWEGETKVREESWNNKGVKLLEAIALHSEAGTLKKWSDEGRMLSLARYAMGYPLDESVFYGNGAVAQQRNYGAEGRLLTFDQQDENGALLSRIGYDAAMSSTQWMPKDRQGREDNAVGRLGLDVLVADDARVTTLVHRGPAILAGVRTGEKILAINDWQLPPAPDEGFVRKRLNGAVGGAVKLVLQPKVGDVHTVHLKRVHRDILDPRRIAIERWSVAGSRVEKLKYKLGFMVEERRWYDSGNKREAADYDSHGRLAWRRIWHENGALGEEIAPMQTEKHLLWREWDESGARMGHGVYLWGSTDKAGSLLKDGVFTYWRSEGGLKSTVNWKEGLKDGAYSSFHESGDLAEEGFFKDDLREGKWSARRPEVKSDLGIPSSSLESSQIYLAGKKHGSFIMYDEQCGWWVEKGGYKDGVKHGEWSTRPGPRYPFCDESGMATRADWSSRNRAEACTRGNYRAGKKYGIWKAKKDCWCESSEQHPCEVLVRKYGNDELLLSEEVSTTF